MQLKLRKSEILRDPVEIQTLFQKGQFISGLYFDFIFTRAGSQGVLFAVSKKVRRNVDRNRVKRVSRELYRHHKGQMTQMVHLAIIGKPKILESDFTVVSLSFQKMLCKMLEKI